MPGNVRLALNKIADDWIRTTDLCDTTIAHD